MAARHVYWTTSLIGVAFLIGSSYSFFHMRQFLNRAVEAPGTVLWNTWRRTASGRHRTGWSAYPQVRFYTADRGIIIFESRTGSNPPAFRLNEPVRVLYDPLDPRHAYIDSFGQVWPSTVVLLVLGVAFNVPAVASLAWRRAAARKETWLRQNGQRVQADLTEVALNRALTVNGAHPYRVVCQWFNPITNQMLVFHSANIWYDPSKFLPGKTLDVLIDPNNPRRYLVETPFLPKTA